MDYVMSSRLPNCKGSHASAGRRKDERREDDGADRHTGYAMTYSKYGVLERGKAKDEDEEARRRTCTGKP